MSATDELLPCPFCGGGVFMMRHPKGFWTVEHKDLHHECPFHIAFFDTKEEAVERWNRRVDHD